MHPLYTNLSLISAVMVAAAVTGREPSKREPAKSDVQMAAAIEAVTKAGYTAVTEISFDDGRWEVEALKTDKPVGLLVDPRTGKVTSEYPDEPHPQLPVSAKSPATIVAELTQAGYGPITKLEFETTGWDVDARRGAERRELKLDLTGKIVADQPDN